MHNFRSSLFRARDAEYLDLRLLPTIRILLALAALSVYFIDPPALQHRYQILAGILSLACYILFTLSAYIYALTSGRPREKRPEHWVDLFFYIFLTALTGGANSIFFSFFFFTILTGSFTKGKRVGLYITFIASFFFSLMVILEWLLNGTIEIDRVLIRFLILPLLGYVIACWGEHERTLKKQLALLNEINNAWSPRLGPDNLVRTNLQRLLKFYDGITALLILPSSTNPGSGSLHTITKEALPAAPKNIASNTANLLLSLPGNVAVVFQQNSSSHFSRTSRSTAIDVVSHQNVDLPMEDLQAIANVIEADCFITAPYSYLDGTSGRLYITLSSDTLVPSDTHFIAQASSAIATVVENSSLVEELVSQASANERLKISRDLHDTTIQPYIALNLALHGLHREIAQDHLVSARIAEIIEMTTCSISDLRQYAAGLKSESLMQSSALYSAIRAVADRFARFYGIKVDLDVEIPAHLGNRNASDAFQIVSEGLSNVLRHTTAKHAYIRIRSDGDRLSLDIGNEKEAHVELPVFIPLTIKERTQGLGGDVKIEVDSKGYTMVAVNFPLRETV